MQLDAFDEEQDKILMASNPRTKQPALDANNNRSSSIPPKERAKFLPKFNSNST